MFDLNRHRAALAILVAFALGACSAISTSDSSWPPDLIPLVTDQRVLLVVALTALVGFVSAMLTRDDRARWSLSMKVFLTLLVLTLASIPLVLTFGPTPPP